jgi:hypothetical protein
MNFTLIKELPEAEKKNLIRFFLKSKPYPFCQMPSMFLALFKIKEYIDFLFDNFSIYVRKDFFIAISVEKEKAIVQFVKGSSFNGISDFEEFRAFFCAQNKNVKVFYTEIQRDYKKQKLIRFIKRRDKNAKINLDNDKICVLWNT